MWQQCFLDSVGVCETISYVRELCIISNILSVLVPHLFYFTLFLDPLFVCMYICIYHFLSTSLLQSFPFPFHSLYLSPAPIFQFFLHPMFSIPSSTFLSQLYSLYSVLVYLPHLPISFPRMFLAHRCASLAFQTLISTFSFKRKFQPYIRATLVALVVDRVIFFPFLHRFATSQNYHFITL